MRRVIKLHIGKMRPFLFITSLVHSLGPPISPKRSKYDITFPYLHSLRCMDRLVHCVKCQLLYKRASSRTDLWDTVTMSFQTQQILMIMCLIMLISFLKFTIHLIITQKLTFSWCDVPLGMMFFLSFLRKSAEDSSPPFLLFSFVRFATSPLESLTQAISEKQ